LQAQLKTVQAQTQPKFLIELAKQPKKIVLKIFPNLLKKIKNATHNPTDYDTET